MCVCICMHAGVGTCMTCINMHKVAFLRNLGTWVYSLLTTITISVSISMISLNRHKYLSWNILKQTSCRNCYWQISNLNAHALQYNPPFYHEKCQWKLYFPVLSTLTAAALKHWFIVYTEWLSAEIFSYYQPVLSYHLCGEITCFVYIQSDCKSKKMTPGGYEMKLSLWACFCAKHAVPHNSLNSSK